MSCHLTKLAAIYSGFKNFAFPNEHFEELAKVRAQICAKCEYADPNHPFKVIEDKRTKEISGMGCSVCRCLLSAKVRQVFESCPKNFW